MDSSIEKIYSMDLSPRGQKFVKNVDNVFEILYSSSNSSEKKMLDEDINTFKSNGRFAVYNTFTGGIYLKEPEVIKSISIDFSTKTNTATIAVKYSSDKRNKVNTRYKAKSGQLESLEWNMKGVFPNFSNYSENIYLKLVIFIGKYVKIVCQHSNKNSLYMNYLKDFDLFLSVNSVLKFDLKINSVLDTSPAPQRVNK